MRERLQSVGWAALLAAVLVWFFHETLFQHRSLVPADILHELILPFNASVTKIAVQNHYALDAMVDDYSWGEFWQESMRAGEWPLWNPYILGGHPHAASSAASVFNPLNFLYLVFSAERAFSLIIILELLLAGVFMFAFLRELGRSGGASFLGACGYGLNSAFILWYWREPGMFAWAPLVLLLFERSLRQRSWRHALAGGLALGVAFLSGNIQAAVQLTFLCVGYFLGGAFWSSGKQRSRTLWHGALICSIAVMVASVQWLSTLEIMALDASGRTQGLGGNMSLRHTVLGISFLTTFFLPGLTGSTETFDLLKLIGASMYNFTGYIGAVPFVLFLIGSATKSDSRVKTLLLVAGCVVGIIFFTPLIRYVYHRMFIVVVFAEAVLAAYGADALFDLSARYQRIVRRTLVGMLGVCLIVAIGLLVVQWVCHQYRPTLLAKATRYVMQEAGGFPKNKQDWLRDRVPMFLDHFRLSNIVFWLPLVSVSGVAFAWLAYRRGKLQPPVLWILLIGLTVCDLTTFGRKLMPQVDLDRFPLSPPSDLLTPMQADSDLFRICQIAPEGARNWWLFPKNLLMSYKLSGIWGDDSVAPKNVAVLPGCGGSNSVNPLLFFPAGNNLTFTRLLDLQNVKYLLTDQSINLPPERFTRLSELDGIRLYRNEHCLPRLQFISKWQVVPDPREMLKIMTAPGFDPERMVLIDRDPLLPHSLLSPPALPATIQLRQYSPRRVLIGVQCSEPGLLLLADTYYPGWKAKVDGQPSRVLLADYVVRAVAVPTGEHTVEFYFQPPWFQVGATISTVTILGVALVWLVWCAGPPRRRIQS